MKIFVYLLALFPLCIPSYVNADDRHQLLKEMEPHASLTSEQGNLEVVNILSNIGDGSEIYYVVKDHEKPLHGVVQIKDGKLVPRLPMEYQYIDEIINDDYRDSIQQYVYCYQDDNQHYVYDLAKERMIKLHLSGKEINLYHKHKYYIGKSSDGELFNLCGTYCGERIAPFHHPGFMELNKESGKFLYHDKWGANQEIDLMNHPPYDPWQYMTISDKHPCRSVSYWIDFPRTNALFDREIRQWISKTIHATIPYSSSDLELYITSKDKSPKGMLDYYSSRFFVNDSIDESLEGEDFYSGYEIKFLKKWESDSYSTYLLSVGEDSPVNSWMDPTTWSRFVTFDKQTGMEINETNIFKDNFDEKINNIIWTTLKENLWKSINASMKEIPDFNVEDAREEFGSILDYLGNEELFDWREGLSSIALTPEGVMIHYPTKSREGTLFTIPYEKIKPFLTVNLGKDFRDVFLESVQRASLDAETINRENFNKSYIPSEQLLATIAQEQGEESGEYLLALSLMAEEYHIEENTKRAVFLRHGYLDIVEKLIGCHNHAWETNAQRQLKDLLKEKEYQKAYNIGEKLSHSWPEDEIVYLDYYERESICEQMLMTAESFFMIGNTTKAIAICNRAIQLAVNKEQSLMGITNKSRYKYAVNDLDSCMFYVSQAIRDVPTYISDKFHEYTAVQRQELWEKFQPWYCEFIPMLAFKTEKRELLNASYDAMLFGKGLLLNTESSIRQVLINSGEKELQKKYEHLLCLKKELNQIRMRRIDPDEKTALTDILLERLRDTERILIRDLKPYGDFTHKINIKTSQIQATLQDHELAIEFCLIGGDYYALLLKRHFHEPKMLKLCSEEQLTVDGDIYTLIWAPIEKYMGDTNNIYFSPTGKLFNIGIENAILQTGEQTINDKYCMFRLSSTRELYVLRSDKFHHPIPQNSVVLYGGIEYEEAEEAAERETMLTYRSAFDMKNISRGSVNVFSYLPGTEKEIKMIRKTLHDAETPIAVTILNKTHATEKSFKSLSGKGNKAIHLATHGFYITKDDADKMSYFSINNISNVNDRYVEDRELLRSGLIMAGAMAETDNGKAGDDGVLTALEVAAMDLSCTDLVVLSACETALGDLSSDGVFGLQRGFKKAGVQSLLMSLWKVDDTATQLLMTEFYKGVMDGLTKREALRNAQHKLRKSQKGKFDKPEYWASFILLDSLDN